MTRRRVYKETDRQTDRESYEGDVAFVPDVGGTDRVFVEASYGSSFFSDDTAASMTSVAQSSWADRLKTLITYAAWQTYTSSFRASI